MGIISTILIFSGLGCVLVAGYATYKMAPREGEPPSTWTSTETRSTALALGSFTLLIAGVSLVLKGIFY